MARRSAFSDANAAGGIFGGFVPSRSEGRSYGGRGWPVRVDEWVCSFFSHGPELQFEFGEFAGDVEAESGGVLHGLPPFLAVVVQFEVGEARVVGQVPRGDGQGL